MRLSSLSRFLLGTVLVLSFAAFAQHSSSGSSSAGSSGGGGSHVSGGSSASSHVASGTGSHSAPSSHAASPGQAHPVPGNTSAKATVPEKKGIFSFLRRHPVQNHQQPVSAAFRPICFKGSCSVCRPGVHGAVGCGYSRSNVCTTSQIWYGDACMLQLHYFNDCFALRQAMRQQELNIRSAEAQRSNACVAGMSQECSEANQQALREESFYQSLLNRYQRCQTLGTMTSDVSGFAAFPWTLSEPMR